MVKEIRIHARAGQGAITTAALLARAAFEEGKHALAFPHFGAERMGAPLNAFVRLSKDHIRDRSQVREPHYVLVQDETLLRGYDVTLGLRDGGLVLVNSDRSPEELGLASKGAVVTVPASAIAQEMLGRADRANTALLGAFAAATEEISLEALKRAVEARFSGPAAEGNVKALDRAYHLVQSWRSAQGGSE